MPFKVADPRIFPLPFLICDRRGLANTSPSRRLSSNSRQDH